MSTNPKGKELELLKKLIPLNTLPEKSLNQLLKRVAVERLNQGEFLFRRGDTEPTHTYLLSGKVSLHKDNNEIDVVAGNTEAARFALAHQFPRQLSARAKTQVECVRVNSHQLTQLVGLAHTEATANSAQTTTQLNPPVKTSVNLSGTTKALDQAEENRNKWDMERTELEQQLATLRSDHRQLRAELDILLSASEEQDRIEQKKTKKLQHQLHSTQLQATKSKEEKEAAKRQIIYLSKEIEEFSDFRQQYLEQIQSGSADNDADEIPDLEQARSEAAEQLEETRLKLQDALTTLEQHDGPGIQAAEMEGLRQEVDQLRRSIRERDQELERAISEQRSLEDAIEDRDAHLEQIKQEIKLTKADLENTSVNSQPPEKESAHTAITVVPFLNPQKTSGDLGELDTPSLISHHLDSPTKSILLGVLIGAILCFAILDVLMVLTGKSEIIMTLLGATGIQNQVE